MRDQILSPEYFQEYITFLESKIQLREKEFKDDPSVYKFPEIHAHQMMMYRVRALICKYSVGYELSDIKADIKPLIESVLKFCRFNKNEAFNPLTSFDNYLLNTWLISFGIIWREDDCLKLPAQLSKHPFDSFQKKLISPEITILKNDQFFYHSRPFESLYALFDSTSEKRQELIKHYLENWYGNMKNTFWYDDHKQLNGGGHFGYWSWELAAMVIKLKIEDSAFADHPNYPRDAVSYFRTLIN